MSTEMFNHDAALKLLQDSWRIKDVEKRLKTDRKALLDEVVVGVQEKVIFQTISVMASEPGRLKRPTFAEIKQNCLCAVGGVCYSINIFTWCLLKALGFSAKVCRARVGPISPATSSSHLVVLVYGILEPNDLFLIDCGCGYPTFQAVPLDFEKESPVYQDSFIKCKYVRDDGMILRMQNSTPETSTTEEIKRLFYSFVPQPDLLEDTIHSEYASRIPELQLTQKPRALLFPRGKAVIIVGNRLMIEKEEGKLETTVLESDEEVVRAYGIHFPQLEEELVRKAITRWRVIQSKAEDKS